MRHRGKATALAEVEIRDKDGKLLATGEYTFFCVGDNWEAIKENISS